MLALILSCLLAPPDPSVRPALPFADNATNGRDGRQAEKPLRNPTDPAGPAPVNSPQKKIRSEIRELEESLGPSPPKASGQSAEQIYDGLNLEEKKLIAAYYRRAIDDGLSEASAKAQAARLFRKFRNVDVNSKMVPQAVDDAERGQRQEEKEQADLAERVAQNERNAVIAEGDKRRAFIRKVDAGFVERKGDRVEWRMHVSAPHRPYVVFWYDVDAAGKPRPEIHVALDRRIDPAIPLEDVNRTRVVMPTNTIDMPSKRDRIIYRNQAWDRVHFPVTHIALEGWGMDIGVGLQFGTIVVKPTEEQKLVLAEFLEAHAKDCKEHGVSIEQAPTKPDKIDPNHSVDRTTHHPADLS